MNEPTVTSIFGFTVPVEFTTATIFPRSTLAVRQLGRLRWTQ